MLTIASPFVFEEPVAPDALIARGADLRLLAGRALDGRNSRIEAPRRFGKTSLVRALLAEAETAGAIGIEVNFLGCVSVADVAERIERAYARQLDSPLRRWFDGTLRTLRPTLSASPTGVGVSIDPQPSHPGLLDRLELPRRLHERTGRQCVIAFDEFQEVLRVDPALPGVFRSELEGQGAAAAYVFSGSHPGLMRSLFAERRHAFFAQATPVALGPLPPDEVADGLTAAFARGRRDPGLGLGPLLDLAAGHPQRTMLLAHHLYERVEPGGTAGIEEWEDARAAALREADGEIEVLWDGSSDLERRVFRIVAERTVALRGREAAERFGLPKSGSVQTALERLMGEGHLVREEATRTGVRVVDPFFAAWLCPEGSR